MAQKPARINAEINPMHNLRGAKYKPVPLRNAAAHP